MGSYAILKIWTKFSQTKLFVGNNFLWTKCFAKQNFRHQAIILTILSEEYFYDKVGDLASVRPCKVKGNK